ncbi:hypothetical protein B7494_g8354 [Chlorociboria aeruginascens]|nr:hypothetical protein B7494_g8354 [Chlorociboria aeruginascens]
MPPYSHSESRPHPHRAPSNISTKRSYLSHSSSFEADDERSSSADHESMGPGSGSAFRDTPSQYAGEDTRLTSSKELLGWYAYGFAAEVFVICGMGSFIPITLEQLARENGVLLSDRTTPCGSSSLRPSVYGRDISANVAKDLGHNTGSEHKLCCRSWKLSQEIIVILRILWLNSDYAVPSYCAESILKNTPEISSTPVEGQVPDEPLEQDLERIDSTSPLIDDTEPLPPAPNLTSVELQLSTQISSTGIGIGYSAGLFVQCLCIIILIAMKSTTFSLRLVLFVVGAWWFVFTIPAAMWLRPRPGPPLPSTSGKPRSWVAYIIYAWASLYRTVKLARRLKDIALFLGAWFLLSDAIATVSGTAVLYAKTQLHMKPEALGLINVIATTAGVLGAFSWSIISRVMGLRPHQTILLCICIFELIPLYGLLGYLPIIKRLGVIGLQQPWEMYPLGFVYGFILGGLSSYCRSLFGELIPPGSEAAFYALYAITDKGSSVFGPAIVGAIVDQTGEIRPAFWFLAFLVGLPGPLIYFVDVGRGREEGKKLAEVIESFKSAEASGIQSGAESQNEAERPLLEADDEEGAYEERTRG